MKYLNESFLFGLSLNSKSELFKFVSVLRESDKIFETVSFCVRAKKSVIELLSLSTVSLSSSSEFDSWVTFMEFAIIGFMLLVLEVFIFVSLMNETFVWLVSIVDLITVGIKLLELLISIPLGGGNNAKSLVPFWKNIYILHFYRNINIMINTYIWWF